MRIKFVLLAVFLLTATGRAQDNKALPPGKSKESWRGVHIGIGNQKAVEQ
ncbi:MAG: hypothetical protein ACYSYM_16640 [Planctomycetota bacterium]|jgi:hypothetical protein